MKKQTGHTPGMDPGFGQFFVRWLRFRRDDLLVMLAFPVGFWLLMLLVVLAASAVEGTIDPEILAVPAVMAVVGGVFAGFITGIGSAGACFTLTVCWGHPRRHGVAALWLGGILYSAVNLIVAFLLQGAGWLISLPWGGQGYLDLLAAVTPVLWALLLIGPTAASVLLKGALRRFGPKAGAWLYVAFMAVCVGTPNADGVMGMDLRPVLFGLVGAAVTAAAVVASVWMLHTPVGGD